MAAYLCVTCGTLYPDSQQPPEQCFICSDERQYVGYQGQQWTTLPQLRTDHHNVFEDVEPGVTSIRTEPSFAIGQRSFLVGGILWDCVALIDESTTNEILARGGITAIAISHPHYYTTMREWSAAFHVPVYLHAADREHVADPGEHLHFWSGETRKLTDELTLIQCGGHFAGGAVMHWSGSGGVLFSGDIIQVVPDRRWVSFMYSYPNYIPLNARSVRRIVESVDPFPFERIYGAFHPLQVVSDAKAAVRRSADRYLRAIAD